MNSSNNSRKSFSLSQLFTYCPRLISPISWWHCFNLLYNPISYEKISSKNFLKSFKYIFLHTLLFILLGLWCYFYWMITFDAGQYLTLLSNISSNQSNITDGRYKFNQLLWRTALKTLFISIDFGLINACAVNLAALWRQRLYIISSSPNGCLLYETAQHKSYDLPTQLTNDIRQFTSHLSIALFGSLFFSGFIAVSTVIIIFSIYIIQQTNGDKNGLLICFGTFAFCVICVIIISYKFNRTTIEQLKSKGKLRSFLQHLQTNAESIAFYASSRHCELISYLKLNQIVHRWNIHAALWYAFINIPLIFMDAIGGFMTYILPSILFFFLRKNQEQTPNEATKCLSIIAFYGYVFWLLSSLIWISESCLIAVTLGENLWNLKQRLLNLQSFHLNRLKHDQISGIKFESSDIIDIVQLRIIIPDEYEQRILQSNINLNAKRGECVLINGSTGCGKTSLFRICAGLWPIDGQCVRLPSRKQTIYISQKPYLPIGSIRFQTLFLLNIRYENSNTLNIDDKKIRDLFKLINMDYLLDRYNIDTIIDWSSYLSLGEQQCLAFIRLFVLFKYHPNERINTLVMFDESTSAVDIKTEASIYQLLNDLHIWFVTISHRSSLIQYHKKELKLYLNNIDSKENNFDLHNDIDLCIQQNSSSIEINETQLEKISTDNIELIKSRNLLKEIKDIWILIHLPFGSDHKILRIQTYIAWCICLIILGCYTYISYRLTIQIGAIFNILPDYAASIIDINESRSQIRHLIGNFILHIIGLTLLYSIQLGIGQFLGALYTQRQSIYISRLLLDDDENHYTLYHTSTLKHLPNIISHDLSELNIQLFYLLIGSIYYNGIIGVLIKCIPYTILLIQESGSTKSVLIIYVYQLFISLLILCVIKPYYHSNIHYENNFSLFTNAQKRIDLQAEQIALNDQCVIDIEQSQLYSKLDDSIQSQKYSGYFYGLLVACSVLGNWSNTIINYAIPSAIFFHFTNQPTALQAASIITLTVYTGYLQANLAVFNSYGQPFSQIWTIGRRITQNLEQLISLRKLHHNLRSTELSSRRRIEIKSIDNFQQKSLELNNVNICISSSTILIRSLSFSLNFPSSLIITGSSGCGKSSLLRLLAGLQYNLTDNSYISIPSRSSMIFIPQQLYFIDGTLREQLNYFRHSKKMLTYNNDQELKNILFKFNLIHLIDRYTLDSSRQIWSKILSFGEQQRLIIIIALITLLKPINLNQEIKYFILDETTAGCDKLTEKIIYEYLQNSNIQYISISHRNQLMKYHTHQLIINQKTQSYEIIQIF